MRVSEVFLKICESFSYISTKDTRLWFKEGGKEWVLVERSEMEKTLEEFIVKDGDVFMVEVKFDKWVRDGKQGECLRDWRNFEVGDKIDVYDVLSSLLLIVYRTTTGKSAEWCESSRTNSRSTSSMSTGRTT